MKKQTQTLLLIGGAGVIAYLVLRPKQQAVAMPINQPAPYQGLIQSASGLISQLFPSQIQRQAAAAASPQNVPVTDLPQASPVDISPATLKPLDLQFSSITPDTTLAGFTPIEGTGLAVLCGCLSCFNRGNRAVGKVDFEKYIIPAAVVIGGYVVLKKFGLFGSNASNSNNAAIAAQTDAANAASVSAAKAQGISQTVSDAQLASIATDIYNKAIASSVDQDGIVMDAIQVNTLTDLLRLKQLFGTKQVDINDHWYSTCSLLGINCEAIDLDGVLKATLDSSHLSTVNNFLSAQGINYKF